MTTLTISCDECSRQDSAACGECLVSLICDRDPADAVIIDAAEARAVRLLNRAGLVPPVRHRPAVPTSRWEGHHPTGRNASARGDHPAGRRWAAG